MWLQYTAREINKLRSLFLNIAQPNVLIGNLRLLREWCTPACSAGYNCTARNYTLLGSRAAPTYM